jgi:hypothetical protein
MHLRLIGSLCLALGLLTSSRCAAQGNNPEDLDIPDESTPTASPVQQPTPGQSSSVEPAPPGAPTNQAAPVPEPPATPATSTVETPTEETVTIPRAVWEQLLRDVEELKRARAQAPTQPSATSEEPPPLEPPAETSGTAAPSGTEAETTTTGSRNYLLLPDISLILQAKGLVSSDKRDEDRRKLGLAEGELGIQGYLYPSVKADAFIVGAPSEDQPFQFEEGYLTFIGLRKGLNLNVGRKFTPFGRTGELHNHSWLYPRQLLPIRNLVSDEALVGDGVNLHYLLPLKGKLFVRASLGAFSGEGTGAQFNATDPTDPFFGGVPSGTGAGFTDRFYTGRLWFGYPAGDNGELDFGVSHARGNSEIADELGNISTGHVSLTGLDATYRRYLPGGKRLLLRSEYFRYKPSDGLFTNDASGWYGLLNYRYTKFDDIGLLYERSGFPQAPGDHENATSLIYTKQLTEQFYIRFMGTHGNRPGDGGYNELRVQFTAGIGPHTHNLE